MWELRGAEHFLKQFKMSDYKHTIEEGNRLIGQFDGWVKQPDFVNSDNETFPHYRKVVNSLGHCHSLFHDPNKYYESWDWLMPVVEKIEAMGHKTLIGGGDYWGNYSQIMYGKNEEEHRRLFLGSNTETKALGKGASKIEAVYLSVIEFIQWYNSTQSK
jgi:hypothetical protein